MDPSLDFILDRAAMPGEPCFSAEDFHGPHASTLGLFRRHAFILPPVAHPLPTCPGCGRGAPYRMGEDWVCDTCDSPVPEEHLSVWPFDLGALLRWFASEQGLEGGVTKIEEACWQLGLLSSGGLHRPCYFLRGDGPSEMARRRIEEAPVLLWAGREAHAAPGIGGTSLTLSSVLRVDGGRLAVRPLRPLLRRGGRVRFTGEGLLYAGDTLLGRVPWGTRAYWFFDALNRRQGQPVPHEEIQDHIRRNCKRCTDQSGASIFCQKRRNELKKTLSEEVVDLLIVSRAFTGCYLMPREVVLESSASG